MTAPRSASATPASPPGPAKAWTAPPTAPNAAPVAAIFARSAQATSCLPKGLRLSRDSRKPSHSFPSRLARLFDLIERGIAQAIFPAFPFCRCPARALKTRPNPRDRHDAIARLLAGIIVGFRAKHLFRKISEFHEADDARSAAGSGIWIPPIH